MDNAANSMDNAANAVDNAANKVEDAADNAANKIDNAADKVENAANNAAPGPTSEPKPFTNEKGELVCPVMKTVIENKDKAVGFQDVDGTRYYFCCGACPEPFKKDPAKYSTK